MAVPVAYAAGGGMTSLLFGVHPGDPLVYAAAALLALSMTRASCGGRGSGDHDAE